MAKKKMNLDGLMNVITGMGTKNSKRSNNQWQFAMLGSWQELDACYQSSWISRKICDIPAEDMTREWRRIKSDGAEEISKFEEAFMLPNLVQEAITWARLYGGSGILMLTDQDLMKPLRVDKIRKGQLKRLITLDRWDMSAMQINTWDVLSSNYLKPEFFTIRGGSQLIHHSHFARFTGERLPLRYMAQTQGWGDSVLRKCIEDITDMVAAKNGIAELMQEANVNVITRPGLTEELASDQDENIINRYTMFRMMISNFQMALLDGGDGSGTGAEKLDRQTLNLSGVAPIIEQFITWISGAADIPVTRMFGTSAKGMNATGDGDDKNYNNSIRAQQRSYLAEPMRQLDEVIVRSALGFWPDDFSYVWNPLSLPTDLDHAQAEQLRSQKHLAYLEAGVVQKSQIQRELQATEEYQFDEEKIDELEALEDGNMFDEPVLDPEQPGIDE